MNDSTHPSQPPPPSQQPQRTQVVDEDYYSLASILAGNTSVNCTFTDKTPTEFFPLVGHKAPDLIPEKGYRASIPTWMVPAVTHTCSITVPSIYNTVNRDVIQANAKVLNLESLQRHFYSLGVQVCRLVRGEEGYQIAMALLAAFTQRIGWLLCRSLEANNRPKQMDELEMRLFAVGQRAERRMIEWWRTTERQTLKRKRTG